ncbi:hypothetical protein [Emticicia sp. 17c]|uniref:hypothetical protein n=1 Tax=Emticicia sp. 17c TaxID=3127704 RepID=UPI00301C8A0E
MTRILITLILLCFELILHYKFNRIAAYPARVLLYSYLIYWCYTESKPKYGITLTEKLYIISCLLIMVSPIPGFIWDSVPGKVSEMVLLMISQHLVAHIWIHQGARINFSKRENLFLKILVPYILIPILFFLFVVVPTFQFLPIVLCSIYVVQLIYITTLSAFVPFPEKSKWYISLAMGLLVFSSGANALRIYVAHYEWDFAVVRITSTVFRVFLLVGLLHREIPEKYATYLR